MPSHPKYGNTQAELAIVYRGETATGVMVGTGTPPERVMGSDALLIEDIQTPADKGVQELERDSITSEVYAGR
jgi:hypothetical protein